MINPSSIPDWLPPLALIVVFLAVTLGTRWANRHRAKKARENGVELDPVELQQQSVVIYLIVMTGFILLFLLGFQLLQ